MAVLEPVTLDQVVPVVHHTDTALRWVQAIRGEYLEIPQLLLTRVQVQACWDLEDEECDEVLDALLGSGFLKVTPTGGFVRA
jgi:hypothetical protein